MSVVAALVFTPLGVLLGLCLLGQLIAMGTSVLTMGPFANLPPPIGPWIASMIGVNMGGFWLIVAIIAAVTFILYWIAGASLTPAPTARIATPPGSELFARGALIGFNAGFNWVFLMAYIGLMPNGLFVASLLPIYCWFACLPAISNNATYQTVLAYAGFFMPSAFFINSLGFLFVTVDTLFMAAAPFRPFAVWPRAGLVIHGGILQGCSRTAYNLCNFSFAHPTMSATDPWNDPGTPIWPFCPGSQAGIVTHTVIGASFHETTHTLNVVAMGGLFHLIGFADEMLPMPWRAGGSGRGGAYAELCAESGLRTATAGWLPIWEPTSAGAVANVIPTVSIAVTAAPGMAETSPPGVFPVSVASERNRGLTLDITGSTDADGFPSTIGRLWSMTPPPGSTQMIATPNAGVITVVPDVGGFFTVLATITDGADGPTVAIFIEALGAVITTGILPPGSGPNTVSLDSATSHLIVSAVGTTIGWEAVDAAGTSVASSATPAFLFTAPGPGDYTVTLRIEQEVPLPAGGTTLLSDTAVTTITIP